MTNQPHLYCILDLGYVQETAVERVTAALLAGGAGLLQLRAKNHSIAVIENVARRVLPLCRAAGVPFILNDHPGLAATLGADGVHLGQADGSLSAARDLTGSDMLIGRSTHSLAQARAALAEGFDYIGFGPLFPTPTKAGRAAIGLTDIAAMEHAVGTHIPAFCIGGIHPGNLPQVLAAGARRIVMVSALLQAEDITAVTRSVATALRARC
jgi:thiamine-phosphate pyrophosphorylase